MTLTLDKHAVPGQAAGYSYQFDLALAQLATGSIGGRVGIETLDDVAKVDGDGNTTLVQGKSTVDSDASPFADGSFGLWNALDTWGRAVAAGEIEPAKTWFDLVSNTAIPPTSLAHKLGEADDAAAVAACIAKLRMIPATPSKKAAPHVAAVRKLPSAALEALIARIRCRGRSEGMSVAMLHREAAAQLKLPSGVDASPVIEELLGWIKVRVHEKWEAKQPAWLLQEHFNDRLHACIESHRRRRVRELPARQLVCRTSDVAKHRTSCFVRQLEIVDVTDQEVEEGIIDFLRHNQERLRLAEEGNISDEDWQDFDQRLVDYWKPVFRQHTRGLSARHVTRRKTGQVIFGETQRHREHLAGSETIEFYLTRGGFHRLANSVTLGWHPDFEALCKPFKG